jgi:hypothetical protein
MLVRIAIGMMFRLGLAADEDANEKDEEEARNSEDCESNEELLIEALRFVLAVVVVAAIFA